jgi:hypothetical protein
MGSMTLGPWSRIPLQPRSRRGDLIDDSAREHVDRLVVESPEGERRPSPRAQAPRQKKVSVSETIMLAALCRRHFARRLEKGAEPERHPVRVRKRAKVLAEDVAVVSPVISSILVCADR